MIKIVDRKNYAAYNNVEQLKDYSNEVKEDVMATDGQTIDALHKMRQMLPDDDTVYNLAEFFKMFGDPTRAKILQCLHMRALYVGELADVLGMSISAVSHQLRVLRAAKLVKGVKEGKEVKYSLDDDHVTQILDCGLTHVKEQ